MHSIKAEFVRLRQFLSNSLRNKKLHLLVLNVLAHRKVKIIVDFRIMPPAFGELTNLVALANILSRIPTVQKVELIFVGNAQNSLWHRSIENSHTLDFFTNFMEFASKIADNDVTLAQFDELVHIDVCDYEVLIGPKISNQPLYRFAFQLAALFYIEADIAFMPIDLKSTTRSGITLALRHNPFWRGDSNVSLSEATQLINAVRESTDEQILIITSDEGATFFKGLESCFADVYIDSSIGFLGSFQAATSGRMFMQFKGGGISQPFIYSGNSYFISCNLGHEVAFNKTKLTPWQTQSQIFDPTATVPSVSSLKDYLSNLGDKKWL